MPARSSWRGSAPVHPAAARPPDPSRDDRGRRGRGAAPAFLRSVPRSRARRSGSPGTSWRSSTTWRGPPPTWRRRRTNRWLGEATAPFRRARRSCSRARDALARPRGRALARRPRPTGPGSDPAPGGRWPRALDVALASSSSLTARQLAPGRRVLLRWARSDVSSGLRRASPRARARFLAVRRSSGAGPGPVRGLAGSGRLGVARAPAGSTWRYVLVGVLASFGPVVDLGALRLRPLYAQLHRSWSRVRRAPRPGALRVLVTTGLAVLAGFGAAALARRLPPPAAQAPRSRRSAPSRCWRHGRSPLPLVSVSTGAGPRGRWLAAQPGPDAVVVLPMYERHAVHLESVRLFASTAHWRPLVNGYAGVFPPGYAEDVGHPERLPGPGRRRAAPDALRPLRGRVPRPVPGRGSRPDLEAALEALPPGVDARRRLRARADLRDRRRGAARVRRRGWCGRRPAPARARRSPRARRPRARRSRRRS